MLSCKYDTEVKVCLYSANITGIYVGEGMVIHFTNGRMQQNGTPTIFDSLFTSLDTSIDTNITCLRCGDSRERNTDGVISSCLDCFLSGGELYLFEYGVSKIHFLARVRGGTCTLASSDPAGEVLFRAFYLLKNGFGGYHFSKNNCEDFAIYCKTSLLATTNISVAGGSGQAATCKAAFDSIASLSLRFVTSTSSTNFYSMTLVSCGTYCYKRLASDIGFRNGVTKVPLEKIPEMAKVEN
jgi:hypothetical protein